MTIVYYTIRFVRVPRTPVCTAFTTCIMCVHRPVNHNAYWRHACYSASTTAAPDGFDWWKPKGYSEVFATSCDNGGVYYRVCGGHNDVTAKRGPWSRCLQRVVSRTKTSPLIGFALHNVRTAQRVGISICSCKRRRTKQKTGKPGTKMKTHTRISMKLYAG